MVQNPLDACDPDNTDTDGDGICDIREILDGTNPDDPCDPNPNSPACLMNPVAVKVFLQGALDPVMETMHDSLRSKGLIPNLEPYTAMPNFLHNGGGEVVSNAVLSVTGGDAIVDWVFLELRDENDPAEVVATRAALIQRDGDVVDVDGVSTVLFDIAPGEYYVSVRHRNHLGVMSAEPLRFGYNENPIIDFTDKSTPTWGDNAQKDMGNVNAMWAGNTNSDGYLIFPRK